MEGQGYLFVTGESFPTLIQVAGYNSRDRQLYLNIDFETTKTVNANQTATFRYVVEVFDMNSNVIGNLKTSVQGGAGAQTASVRSLPVSIAPPLPAHYRVVTVTSVEVA